MGVGTRSPKPANQPPPATIDGAPTDGSGGASAPSELPCWEFTLVEPTDVVSKIHVGDSVTGIPEGPRVMVASNLGPLGFTPSTVAARILATLREHAGCQLTGSITQLSGNAVRVVVCLVA